MQIDGKRKLFERYSKNLELFYELILPDKRKELSGKYACPICFKQFTIEDLDTTKLVHLTEEHIPPKSVGWRRQVLTCKKCNNDHGGKFDGHLQKILRLKSFNMRIPGTTIPARLIYNEYRVNGLATVKQDNNIEYELNERGSNPTSLQVIKSMLQSSPEKLTMDWAIGDTKLAMISMIRAAYLWGFAEFGYAFTYNPNFRNLLSQLDDADSNIFSDRYVIYGDFPEEFSGLNLVTRPNGVECYAFIMNLKAYGLKDNICVLLPGADRYANERLDHLRFLISTNPPDLEYFNLQDSSVLTDSEKCFYMMMYWIQKYEDE